MTLATFIRWALMILVFVAVSVSLPNKLSAGDNMLDKEMTANHQNDETAELPADIDKPEELTKAQKEMLVAVYGGIGKTFLTLYFILLKLNPTGPAMGPFSAPIDKADSSNAPANSDFDLEESKLNSVIGNIDWKGQPDTLDEAEVVRWTSLNNPKQIHLSLGNSSAQMVVMWVTQDPVPSGIPIVAYGLKENSLTNKRSGSTINFYERPEFTGPNGTDPDLPLTMLQHHHRVEMTDLLPNSTYFYQILCDNCYSPIYSFKTMPSNQNWASFLVYGDMGRLYKAPILEWLTKDVLTGNYDAILHVGDFAYDLDDLNGVMGDSFFNQIEPLSTRLPYMVCPGNHEMNHWQAALHYVHRFSMPQLPWPMDEANLWYSFNVANVHFVGYSSEVYFSNRTTDERERQKTWLDQDLTEANLKTNRDHRPWIIAFGHRPMYCSNRDRDDCTQNNSLVRLGLEELFFRHGVDVIIEAHEHSYERLWPVYNNRVWGHNYTNPGAPVHLVAGAAGCNEQFSYCLDIILGARGPWSAYHTSLPGSYGYARLQVVNATHLRWEQILSVNGQVVDSVWLEQHHHGPFSEW